MTPHITDEIRQAIDREPGAPVHVIDAERQAEYVLIPVSAYDRIVALFGGQDPFDIRETYGIQDQVAAEAWSHPGDADYDHDDAHRCTSTRA